MRLRAKVAAANISDFVPQQAGLARRKSRTRQVQNRRLFSGICDIQHRMQVLAVLCGETVSELRQSLQRVQNMIGSVRTSAVMQVTKSRSCQILRRTKLPFSRPLCTLSSLSPSIHYSLLFPVPSPSLILSLSNSLE